MSAPKPIVQLFSDSNVKDLALTYRRDCGGDRLLKVEFTVPVEHLLAEVGECIGLQDATAENVLRYRIANTQRFRSGLHVLVTAVPDSEAA